MPSFSKKKKRACAALAQTSRNEKACVFCEKEEDDEEKYGKFLLKNGIRVHNFCMWKLLHPSQLFASGLSQNGEDDEEGILGFLESDIRKELRRASKMNCRYCGQVGASVGCAVKSCKSTFHLSCGMENQGLFQFFDVFNVFCLEHRPCQEVLPEEERGSPRPECPICFCDVANTPSLQTLRGPCCTRAWYHRQCIQTQAKTAGLHFFRCPLCNDQKTFQKEMQTYGIYIPDQDAAWETEPNAFHELLERYSNCDVENCLCPQGRKYDEPQKGWNLLICCTCSSVGAHGSCVGLKTRNPDHEWTCKDCRKIVGAKYKKKGDRRSGKTDEKEERSPYKPTYNPIKRGLKRKRSSAWARGMVKNASKRLRLAQSPWKTVKTVSLLGQAAVCGASPKSAINCTDQCTEGRHRPRIPKLNLNRTPLSANFSVSNGGENVKEPSCSTPRTARMKLDFRAPPLSPVGTSKWKHSDQVEYCAAEEDTIDLMSGQSETENRETSSPDSDLRRAAMEFCVMELDSSYGCANATHRQAAESVYSRGACAAVDSSSSDCTTQEKGNFSSGDKKWNISFSSRQKAQKETRRSKPRSKMPVARNQKSLLSYFVPIGGRTSSPETEKKERPVMSVKPTRKESSDDDYLNEFASKRAPRKYNDHHNNDRFDELKKRMESPIVVSDDNGVDHVTVYRNEVKCSPTVSKYATPRTWPTSPTPSTSKETPPGVSTLTPPTASPKVTESRGSGSFTNSSFTQKHLDDFSLKLSDSDLSDVDVVAYEDLIRNFAEGNRSQPIVIRDNTPPVGETQSKVQPKPLIVVVSSDNYSDDVTTSSDIDDVITLNPRKRDEKTSTSLPVTSAVGKTIDSELSTGSGTTNSSGLFDLKNLKENLGNKSSSSSDCGLFDLKSVPGFKSPNAEPELISSQSDQENSEPNSTTPNKRKKRLRLKRKKSELVRVSPMSSSSSSDSLSRLPLVDKRPIGIVQPTRSADQNT